MFGLSAHYVRLHWHINERFGDGRVAIEGLGPIKRNMQGQAHLTRTQIVQMSELWKRR